MSQTSYDLWDRCVLVEVGPAGGTARAWSDLRVTFSVKRTLERKPNEAQVSISNLSRDSSAWCRTKGHVLRLSAGYGGVPEQLFIGGIDRAERTETPPDSETKIEAADGGREFRDGRIAKSYAGQVMLSTVLQDLATAMGLGLGFVGTFADVAVTQGLALTGPARDQLDRVCRSLGMTWSIQDGAIQVVLPSGATPEPAVLLTPDTGLIGSPTPVADKKAKGKIDLICLLQPSLRPGRRFQLESRDFKGIYKAEDVEHKGDTHGQDWCTTITAREAS